MIYWKCQYCGHEIEEDDDMAGEHLNCPKCRALTRVPGFARRPQKRSIPDAYAIADVGSIVFRNLLGIIGAVFICFALLKGIESRFGGDEVFRGSLLIAGAILVTHRNPRR